MKQANYRLPTELIDRVKVAARRNGITTEEFVRIALEKYLEGAIASVEGSNTESIGLDDLENLEKRVLSLLEQLEIRLDAKIQAIAQKNSFQNALDQAIENTPVRLDVEQTLHQKPLEGSRAKSGTDARLTTSEAHQRLIAQGWSGSPGTFRRRLADGSIPIDLQRYGLRGDFDARALNPRSNQLRWLWFEPQ